LREPLAMYARLGHLTVAKADETVVPDWAHPQTRRQLL